MIDDDPPNCCGVAMTWDAAKVGTTVGGLEVQGWWACSGACGCCLLGTSKGGGIGHSKAFERWTLAAGGRSVDTGITRIRAEKCADPRELFERIVRLPAMERALAAIAAGAPNAAALAKEALGG